jgi:WD40 repeat protein
MFDCDSKLREYSLGTSWVSSVAIFDDKNGVPHVLAANNYSGTIMKIWDATLDTVEPVYLKFASLKWNATCLSDNLPVHYSATVKSAHKEGIMDVEVIDHETFASGGNDRAIKIWKWQGDKLVLHQAGTGHTDYVAKVLYIPGM